MNAESIQAIAASASGSGAELDAMRQAALSTAAQSGGVASAAPVGFGELVSQGLSQVNAQLQTSQTDLQRLAMGDVQNLHQVMIGLEESRLSFQLFMQVRNRLLEAYQDVMKMQI